MKKKFKKAPQEMTATVNLSVSGKPLRLEMKVPTERTRPARMLPLFRSMSETFVGVAVENARAGGLEVSCAKGCAACCRHMIPIAEFEARELLNLVNSMPEPQKSIIVGRFREAIERMSEAGLLDKLRAPEQMTKEEYRAFGLQYFGQGVACPFLEEESCSIHLERPLVCREYLVVSPAENCSRQNGEPVKVLTIPLEMSKAARCFNAEQSSERAGWIPLITALEWAETHADKSPARPGTEILRELFSHLTGRDVPKSAS